ncbi:oligosaccharide flippase family protein [Candidatus Kaiserbacteria bacterium]|nr:oligosaccharide flippase family protein [Candidatus Kaiserbacteria bacterium]
MTFGYPEDSRPTTVTESPRDDVLRLSIMAGRWQFLNTAVQQVLSMGTFLVLARILAPTDFGVAALIMTAPNFLDGITTFSFDVAALQKKDRMRDYLNVVWTFNICRAALIFLVATATAPFIAHFFHIEYALPLLYLAGIGILVQSFFNIGQNFLFLTLDLKKIFYRDIAFKVGYAAAAIPLAFLLHSYLALFLATIVSIICVTAATYVIHPYRPHFDFAFGKLYDLRHAGQWLYAQEIAGQFERTIGDGMIGRFATPTDLGLFSKAKSLAAAVISPLISNINKVSFSSYLHVRDSLPHISEGISKTFDILFAFGLPYVLVIILTGRRLVLIVLGPNWVDLTPYLKVLVISATLNALSVILASAVFNGIGKPRTQFAISAISTGSILTGFLVLVPLFGIWGAVYATLLGSVIATAATIYFMLIHVPLNWPRIITSLLITIIACITPIPLAIYLLSLPFFNTTVGYLFLLAVGGTLYAGIIAAAGIILRKGPYDTFVLLAQTILGSILPRIRAFSRSAT